MTYSQETATNQAGEVERISKALFEADPDVGCPWEEWVAYAEAHPDHLQSVDFVRRQAHAVAALPAPPATSQEGEGLIGGGIVFYDRGGYCVSLSGVPFEATADGYTFIPLTDAQVDTLSTYPLAAPPTPPILSKDLREDVGNLIARLGVKHCYVAQSDIAEARRHLAAFAMQGRVA